jgi:hypothetical protein
MQFLYIYTGTIKIQKIGGEDFMQGIANKAAQGKKPYKNEYQILTTVKNCYSSGPWILNHIIYCFDQEVMFEFKC